MLAPSKFFGPHLGLAFARAEHLERWRPYKVRPARDEPLAHRDDTGTLPHELLAGFIAAVDYVGSVGYDAIEIMRRLGLDDGARVGIDHYNTADEVDRLLAELTTL